MKPYPVRYYVDEVTKEKKLLINTKSICKYCGVNQIHLFSQEYINKDKEKEKSERRGRKKKNNENDNEIENKKEKLSTENVILNILEKICNTCEDKYDKEGNVIVKVVPCVLVHVSEVAYTFNLTPFAWFLQRIKGLKSMATVVNTGGSIYHAFENYINKQMVNKFTNLKKVDNKIILFYRILNMFLRQLEYEVIKVLHTSFQRFGFIPYDVIPFLLERNLPMLSKLSHRETERIWNAKQYKMKFNPYKKISDDFETERLVYFYNEFEFSDYLEEEVEKENKKNVEKKEEKGKKIYIYRVISVGNIDKVFDLDKENSIGYDIKSAVVPKEEYESYTVQFGGYQIGHEFTYDRKLSTCIMEYPMFDLQTPIVPDSAKYIKLLKDMCEVDYFYNISDKKKLLVDKSMCKFPLCKENFCGLFYACQVPKLVKEEKEEEGEVYIGSVQNLMKHIVKHAKEEIEKWKIGESKYYNNECEKIFAKYYSENIKIENKKEKLKEENEDEKKPKGIILTEEEKLELSKEDSLLEENVEENEGD